MTNHPDAIIRKHVIGLVNFINWHNIWMRAKHRNRKLAKEDFRQKLEEWHLTAREKLVWTNTGERYDQKWGSFLPNQCFNVNQSPMLNIGQDQNQEKVWISQPGCGLKKRSVHLANMFSSWSVQPEQPRIAMF